MHRSSFRIAIFALIFAAALGGALLLLRGSESGAPSPGNDDRAVASSDIWKLGDAWTVKVEQDAGAIAPGGEENVATIPFRFEVTDAPQDADGAWIVTVQQDGAEGPFAKGWRLHYQERDGVMHLHRVATGDEPPLEAELAAIVLGPQFPYEVTYASAPKDASLDAADLHERATLPPSTIPGAGADDAPSSTPPAEAPKLDAGGAPATR